MEITDGSAIASGSIGVGWVQGTIRLDRDKLVALLGPFVGCLTGDVYATRWYACASDLGDNGSMVAWSPRQAGPERAQEHFLQIKQTDCDALGFERSAELVGILLHAGFKPTRVDVYYDDKARHQDPAGVWSAFRAGQVVTHIRKGNFDDHGEDGSTTYLGKRGSSEVFIRVYDKDAEREATPGTYGIRWEVQAHQERATWLVATVLLADQVERSEAFASVLASLCDFRDRVGVVNGNRTARLNWWEELVGSIARATHRPAMVADSLAKRLKWFVRQVAPTFALLFDASGGDLDWMVSTAIEGRKRWGLREHRLLRVSLAT